MRFVFVPLVAAAWLIASPAAAAQVPAPPANDDCLACHGDHFDSKQFNASIHGPIGCVDCHADLAKQVEFPHADRLARVQCASCHSDIESKYRESMHAWAKNTAGLVGAPACADCHGTHDIRPHTDAASRVSQRRIPDTCGSCHAGIKQQFDRGIHAAKLKIGDSRAPSCADCHTAHAIQRAEVAATRLAVAAQCGSCHAGVVDSFRRTFHGKVAEMGFATAATCADCHGAHDILPAANSSSRVSKARLVQTCGRCHAGANDQFVKYDPHPNPSDYGRGAVLWWANRFYWLLIPGCFGFFALHSALWFWRERKDGRP